MATRIIAITGPSGSGKSYLAQALHQEVKATLPHLSIETLAEDSYYHDQADVPVKQRQDVNYDHPSALEHDLMLEHLQQLKSGQAVEVPAYDYSRHTRSEESRLLHPVSLLIVEGILLLSHHRLRQHFDLRLFVDTPLDVCLARRMERDIRERGRSPESVQQQFESTVRPMFHAHIEPTRDHAHMVLSGEEPVSDLAARIRREIEAQGYLPDQAE